MTKTVNDQYFDIVVQNNEDTKMLELFILVDSTLPIDLEIVANMDSQGVELDSYYFPARKLLAKMISLNSPIYNKACLLSVDLNGDTVQEKIIPLTVHLT